MGKDLSGEKFDQPTTSGNTDDKGYLHEKETYDRGAYTENYEKVTKTNGDVDIYIDKNFKR